MGLVSKLELATNNTGTNLVLQITAPTNPTYSNTVISWRLWHRDQLDTITTNNVTSGSFTISSLTERELYEVWGTPVLSGGSIQTAKTTTLIAAPTSGSVREKVLSRVQAQVQNALTTEQEPVRNAQVQVGSKKFRGKFRGNQGVCLIYCDQVTSVPYTNDSRYVTYVVHIHFAWLDKRIESTSDVNLGTFQETIRLTLDAAQDTNIPNIIDCEVTDIPFVTDVFDDLGEDIRGFSLAAKFNVHEYITSI